MIVWVDCSKISSLGDLLNKAGSQGTLRDNLDPLQQSSDRDMIRVLKVEHFRASLLPVICSLLMVVKNMASNSFVDFIL